jgi:hypothetical protein
VHHDEAFTFSDDFKYGRSLIGWYSYAAILQVGFFAKEKPR